MASHIDPRDVADRTVAGLFPDRARAEQAIDALKAAGFTGDQIGVALRDRTVRECCWRTPAPKSRKRLPPRGRSGADSWGPHRLVDRDRRPGHSGPWTGRGRWGVGDRLRGGWGHGSGRRGHRSGRWESSAPSPASGCLNRRHATSRLSSGPVVCWSPSRPGIVLEAMAILDRHGADAGPATGPGPSGLTPRWG